MKRKFLSKLLVAAMCVSLIGGNTQVKAEEQNSREKFMSDLGEKLSKASSVSDEEVSVLYINNVSEPVIKGSEVNFDLDSDGIAEKTEWTKEAMFVRDLNGNGIIDNGMELVGAGQKLSDGNLSTSGISFLKDMDSNKDEELTKEDEGFSQLKIWVDDNLNGVTDEGELKSLEEYGINKIDFSKDVTYRMYAEKEDGTSLTGYDICFKSDFINDEKYKVNIHDNIEQSDEEVSEEIKALPNVSGIGSLTDLKYAMMKDDTLKSLVKEYIASPKIKNVKLIDEILFRWCGVEEMPIDSRSDCIDARVLGVIEKFIGTTFNGTCGKNPGSSAGEILLDAFCDIRNYVSKELEGQSYLLPFEKMIETKSDDNNEYYDFSSLEKYIDETDDYEELVVVLKGMLNKYRDNEKVYDELNNIVSKLKENSWEFLRYYDINNYIEGKEGVDRLIGVSSQGYENDYINGAINDYIKGTDQNEELIGVNGNDILDGGAGNDVLEGRDGDDTYIFGKGYGRDLIYNWSNSEIGTDILKMKDIRFDEVTIKRAGSSLTIMVNDSDDKVVISDYFKGGMDSLALIEFSDGTRLTPEDIKIEDIKIDGTDGDDSIDYSSERNFYTVSGMDGNDSIKTGSGNDVLDGGAGDDYLEAGAGDDKYIFDRGYGNDIINNYSLEESSNDILEMKNIKFNEVKFAKENNDLIISILDTEDSITIKDYFLGGCYGSIKINFQDKKDLDNTQLNNCLAKNGMKISGTDEDDVIDYSGETIKLFIEGKNGDDTIKGGSGDDTLDGGLGNDYLEGGEGNNTYIFAKGYGQDVIDNSSSKNSSDKLVLKDIIFEKVDIIKDSNDLVLKVKDTEDSVRIKNYFLKGSSTISKISFDGINKGYDQITSYLIKTGMDIEGTEGNDNLDYSTEELAMLKISGKSGDDIIKSGAGNDILDGGPGNDYLEGGEGINTYIFGRGYGQDVINNYSSNTYRSVLELKDLSSDEVSIIKEEKDLILRIKDTNEAVTIKNYFLGSNYRVYKINFTDCSKSSSSIESDLKYKGMKIDGTNGDDNLDYSAEDIAKIIINGKEGNDTIKCGRGDDTLDGGAGNDYLEGGDGRNTYIFGKGYGHDTINNYGLRLARNGVLQMKDINIDEVELRRNDNDLVITVKNSEDSVTVQNYFLESNYKVNKITFADEQYISDYTLRKYLTK